MGNNERPRPPRPHKKVAVAAVGAGGGLFVVGWIITHAMTGHQHDQQFDQQRHDVFNSAINSIREHPPSLPTTVIHISPSAGCGTVFNC
jgi:hypothetical protein